MDLDMLIYIVMGLCVLGLLGFTLYIRHKRKDTMIIIDDGVNEFEVLEKLLDDLEATNNR